MDNSRLTKQIFIHDYTRALQHRKGWNKEVKGILQSTGQEDVFYGLGVENPKKVLQELKETLAQKEEEQLMKEINSMPKLRSYKEVKLNAGTEGYIKSNLDKYSRSLISKLRIGTLPINIELGRYSKQPIEDRTCHHCRNKVETEKHFLLECPLYEEERQKLFRLFQNKNNIDLKEVTPEESFYLLLNVNNISKQLAQMIQNSLQKRQQLQN